MFERFTDRARRSLTLAQREAETQGSSHLGTEHVLLGLMAEGEGVAAKVLLDPPPAGLGLELDRMRKVAQALSGGTEPSPKTLPFTPEAKRVMEFSLREALQLGHNWIGTEHLLLGVIREPGSAEVLVQEGIDLALVRKLVIERLAGYERARDSRTVTVEMPQNLAHDFCRWIAKVGVLFAMDPDHIAKKVETLVRKACD